jgi:hypothetical protein
MMFSFPHSSNLMSYPITPRRILGWGESCPGLVIRLRQGLPLPRKSTACNYFSPALLFAAPIAASIAAFIAASGCRFQP